MKKSLCLMTLIACAAIGGVSQVQSQNSTFGAVRALKGKVVTKDGKFYSDFASHEDMLKAGNEYNKEINAEAFTLLKNDNNTLPFKHVNKVTVFGKGAADPVYSGGGSGASKSSVAPIDFYQALEDGGYVVNPVQKAFYDSDVRSGVGAQTGSGNIMGSSLTQKYIGETPMSQYDGSVKASWDYYSDAAIVVLTRSGSEGQDNPLVGVQDYKDGTGTERHYFALSDNERAMIATVKEKFDKVVVLLNSPSAMEVADLQADEKIGAILWVGTPGYTGLGALGGILNGSTNPSGATIDIYATDMTKDPTFKNMGANSTFMKTGDDGKAVAINGQNSQVKAFREYEEGIYVGYRYYESAYADATDGDTWYADNVIYPFGYGLSYTSFKETSTITLKKADGVTVSSLDEAADGGYFDISVEVENTGDVAGKDIVEAYYHAPYIDGEVEKAEVILGDFTKTLLLEPGEKQVVSLKIYVQDMASYDYNDANSNDHKGYELDAGDYKVVVAEDSHDAAKKVKSTTTSYALAADKNYDKDRITGNTVENRFEGVWDSMPGANDVGMTMMTRAKTNHFVQPVAPTDAECLLKADSKVEKIVTNVFDTVQMEDDTKSPYPGSYKKYTASDLAGASQIAEDATDRSATKPLTTMVGKDLNDPEWDTYLNNMKYSELLTTIGSGYYSTNAVDAIGKPRATESDGPSSISQVAYCAEVNIAATWNVEIAEEMARLMGDEALWANINGWYGPAMNTHRSPFSGRNFEYYSEDPLLSGKMAASAIQGAQSKGLYAFAKHFAVNDQEMDRMGVSTYLTEQSMREIYLKPFQMAVEEGNVKAIMSSFNRIGIRDASSNYALLTEVLRDEWGFTGVVETDYFVGGESNAYQNTFALLPSGGDLPLGRWRNQTNLGTYNATKKVVEYTYTDLDATNYGVTAGNKIDAYNVWYNVRNVAKRTLYVASQSNQLDNGHDLSAFVGSTLSTGASVSFNQSIAVTGLSTGDVSYTSSNLPDGVTLSKDGALSGTIATAGTYTFNVTMHVDGWVSKTETFTLNVEPAFTCSADLGALTLNQAVNATFATKYYEPIENNGRTYNISYAVNAATPLPEGLALSSEGALTGTPTKAGTYNVTLDVSVPVRRTWGTWVFVSNQTVHQDVTIVVTDPSTPTDPEPAEEDYSAEIAELKKEIEALKNSGTDTSAIEARLKALEDGKYGDGIADLKKQIEELKNKSSSGCGGSIIAATSSVAAVALVGVGFVLKKKKEEK